MNILKYIKYPPEIILLIDRKTKILHLLPDKIYLKLMFRIKMHKRLNLENPQTFNEKLQWLKLYDRNPDYTKMVDKYEAKKYVADIIGEEYIIPTLGIYDKFEDIDFSKLPKQFVIKCTHDSGGLVICRDKDKLDIANAKKKIENSLKHNYYYHGREWPYKNVKPRIIIEQYMEDYKNSSLVDYKFFCFNGEPQIMYVSEGLENHATASISFYDMDFNEVDIKRSDYKKFEKKPEIPLNFENMKEFSKILSKDIPHLRCDWYEINKKLYFGELTFSTCGGYIPFENEKMDYEIGNMLKL